MREDYFGCPYRDTDDCPVMKEMDRCEKVGLPNESLKDQYYELCSTFMDGDRCLTKEELDKELEKRVAEAQDYALRKAAECVAYGR
jgi:hypothetical protein